MPPRALEMPFTHPSARPQLRPTHALSAQKRELKQKTLPSGNAHLSSRRWLPKGLVLAEATLDVTKLDTFTKRMGKKKKKKGISLL